jgi:hypothetical protein
VAGSAKLIIVSIVLLVFGFCIYNRPAKTLAQLPPPESQFLKACHATWNRFNRHAFSPDMVSSTLTPNPRWMINEITTKEQKQIQSILSQPFTFFGEGAQAIAFQSKDEKYVLKLFKMRRFTPSVLDQLCPHVVRRRLRNLHWVFNGYKNAYEDLRKETGVVWIHLAKTNDMNQKLTLIDQEGRLHYLDADETEFVVQEKAELLFHRLERLAHDGKLAEVEKAIQSVCMLVQHRIDKGYADRDKAVSNNYGFVGDRPIQLDVGRLYKGTKERQLEHVKERIERWKSERVSS